MTVILRKISNAVNKVFIVMSVIFLIAVTVACFIQVVARYVFNNSLSWTEEFARYCFIWATMSGVTIATKNGAHATIDLIVSKFKGKLRTIHHAFADASIMVVCFLFIYHSMALLEVTSRQTSVAMGIPMNYIYLAVPVGAAGMLIHILYDLCATLFPEKQDSAPEAETYKGEIV